MLKLYGRSRVVLTASVVGVKSSEACRPDLGADVPYPRHGGKKARYSGESTKETV